jgi:hypothetical protein
MCADTQRVGLTSIRGRLQAHFVDLKPSGAGIHHMDKRGRGGEGVSRPCVRAGSGTRTFHTCTVPLLAALATEDELSIIVREVMGAPWPAYTATGLMTTSLHSPVKHTHTHMNTRCRPAQIGATGKPHATACTVTLGVRPGEPTLTTTHTEPRSTPSPGHSNPSKH